MTNRVDHVAWCKSRAIEYLDEGDLASAVTSMASDLAKHPQTRCPPALAQLGYMAVVAADEPAVRRWIEGFN